MLGRGEAVSVEQAQRLISKSLSPHLPAEVTVGIEESFERVLSGDIYAPEDLPGFPRSAMDGYAVNASDTFGAGEGSPAYLDVTHEIHMGDEPGFKLNMGEASRISTGGMLPEGADAVLMLEHAQDVEGDMIEAQRPVAPGDNVIQRGEDIKEGELLLGRGRRLKPRDVAALAGIGITEVSVYEMQKVSIISTGDEVVPPNVRLRPGLVRDTNSYALAGLVHKEGCVPRRKGIISDDYGLIRDTVAASVAESAGVLITGGSSVGTRDLTERVIQDLGTVLFHGVSLKPGKPLLFGIVGNVPVFGLPGHPRAVYVCFELFVTPVLRVLAGEAQEGFGNLRNMVRARLTKSVHSTAGREEIISVFLEDSEGELLAVPILGKSGLISTMLKAHGTIRIPSENTGLQAGENVEVKLS